MDKKLYRIEQGKLLCGVCGGIAEYFGVDPTVIRVVWAIVACCGAGLLAYIICAIVMPVKPTNVIEAE